MLFFKLQESWGKWWAAGQGNRLQLVCGMLWLYQLLDCTPAADMKVGHGKIGAWGDGRHA
jgi:hypothetical protein